MMMFFKEVMEETSSWADQEMILWTVPQGMTYWWAGLVATLTYSDMEADKIAFRKLILTILMSILSCLVKESNSKIYKLLDMEVSGYKSVLWVPKINSE